MKLHIPKTFGLRRKSLKLFQPFEAYVGLGGNVGACRFVGPVGEAFIYYVYTLSLKRKANPGLRFVMTARTASDPSARKPGAPGR